MLWRFPGPKQGEGVGHEMNEQSFADTGHPALHSPEIPSCISGCPQVGSHGSSQAPQIIKASPVQPCPHLHSARRARALPGSGRTGEKAPPSSSVCTCSAGALLKHLLGLLPAASPPQGRGWDKEHPSVLRSLFFGSQHPAQTEEP